MFDGEVEEFNPSDLPYNKYARDIACSPIELID